MLWREDSCHCQTRARSPRNLLKLDLFFNFYFLRLQFSKSLWDFVISYENAKISILQQGLDDLKRFKGIWQMDPSHHRNSWNNIKDRKIYSQKINWIAKLVPFVTYDLQKFYILTVHNSIYSYTTYNRQKGSTIFGDKLMAYCNVNWSSGISFPFPNGKE